MKIQADAKKVSSITGKNASIKKDGYASGSVPPSMRGNKDGKPYSGPEPLATPTRD